MEQHAFLHRRQRIDIFQFPHVTSPFYQLIQLGHGYMFKHDIAWRQLLLFAACAMRNDFLQTDSELFG
ncbi:hypothetical protein D1872_214880 [compost metagenome]